MQLDITNSVKSLNYNNLHIIKKQVSNRNHSIDFYNDFINMKLQGFTNSFIKAKIINKIGLSALIKNNNKLKFNDINHIINKLSCSGFFYYVRISIKYINDKIYLIIYLQLNPIVKNINIINFSNLKIPKIYLKNLLDSYIGYPQNFNTHKKITEQIESWYSFKGYKWTKALTYYTGTNQQNLNLDILEGKICKYEIKCINSTNNALEAIINNLITQELKILPGQILNLYYIEKGITKLKKQRIISHCTYQVLEHNNNIKILVKYRKCKKQTLYYFNKYQYNSYLFYNLFFNYLYFTFVTILKNNLVNWSSFPAMIYYTSSYLTNNLFIDKLINLNFSTVSSKLGKMYIHSDRKIFKHYKRLLYYMHSLSKKQDNLLMNLEFKLRKSQVNLYYLYPEFHVYSHCKSQAAVHIFRYAKPLKKSTLPIKIGPLLNKISNQYNQGLSCFLENFVSSYIKILQQMDIKTNSNREYLLSSIYFYEDLKFVPTIKKTIYKVKKINKLRLEKLIFFKTNIIYDKLEINDKLIPGNFLNFKIKSLNPIVYNAHCFCFKENKQIKLRLKYVQTIKFYKNLLKKLTHLIKLKIKIKASLKKQNFPSISTNYIKTLPIYFIQTKLAYYMPLNYRCFWFTFTEHFYTCINNSLSMKSTKLLNANTTIGTGIQVDLPLKQLPLIKLEVGLQITSPCKFYTKLHFR